MSDDFGKQRIVKSNPWKQFYRLDGQTCQLSRERNLPVKPDGIWRWRSSQIIKLLIYVLGMWVYHLHHPSKQDSGNPMTLSDQCKLASMKPKWIAPVIDLISAWTIFWSGVQFLTFLSFLGYPYFPERFSFKNS